MIEYARVEIRTNGDLCSALCNGHNLDVDGHCLMFDNYNLVFNEEKKQYLRLKECKEAVWQSENIEELIKKIMGKEK